MGNSPDEVARAFRMKLETSPHFFAESCKGEDLSPKGFHLYVEGGIGIEPHGHLAGTVEFGLMVDRSRGWCLY